MDLPPKPSSGQISKRPEFIFLILAIIAGVTFCFLIPPGAGFDEITHLARVWEMSGGYLIPNQKLGEVPYLPLAFTEVSYRNRFFYTPLESDYFERFAEKRIDWNTFTDHQTRSVYFPLYFLPQAFLVGVMGRVLDLPVLYMYYLPRLTEMLGYILLAFFAIRLIPFGKWTLAFLALAPMAMFQAATISTDVYTNGASFLWIGWVLSLAFQVKPISWKQTWVTVLLAALLLSGKVNTVFLLGLLVLLPPSRFQAKRQFATLLISCTVLLIGLVVLWNGLVYRTFYANVEGYGMAGQLAYILQNPIPFLQTFFGDIGIHGMTYLKEWVAIYAYNVGVVPPVVYAVFGACLLTVLVLDRPAFKIPFPTRALLVGLFLAGYAFTICLLYLSVNRIGSPVIEGVQGRYLTLVAPLLLLGLIPNAASTPLTRTGARVLVALGSALALAAFGAGIYLSFYVTCGTSYYTAGSCYQPPYKNWDPNAQFTAPVAAGDLFEQSFRAACEPISSVRVWAAAPLQSGGSDLRVILRDLESNAVLAEVSANPDQASNHSWLEVPFAPVSVTTGKSYGIEVTSTEINPDRSPAFAVSARREYFEGEFSINGRVMDYDLLFQYGCER